MTPDRFGPVRRVRWAERASLVTGRIDYSPTRIERVLLHPPGGHPLPLIDDIDLANPDTLAAGVPHEYFSRLRNENPVYWHESATHPPGFWVCTKYQDVIDIERDAKTFSSARGGALLDDQGEGTELMMLNQDPPQHTRLRNLVARGFTPKVIKGMEPHIREASRLIVDRVATREGRRRLRAEPRGRAAARRHRGAARHPVRRPAQGLRVVEPAHRGERPRVRGARRRGSDGGVDGAVRVRAEPGRRPTGPSHGRHRHDARDGRARRREALGHRVQRLRAVAVRRRQRDDAQPDQWRDARA